MFCLFFCITIGNEKYNYKEEWDKCQHQNQNSIHKNTYIVFGGTWEASPIYKLLEHWKGPQNRCLIANNLNVSVKNYLESGQKWCYSPAWQCTAILSKANPRKSKIFRVRVSSTSSILTWFSTYGFLPVLIIAPFSKRWDIQKQRRSWK